MQASKSKTEYLQIELSKKGDPPFSALGTIVKNATLVFTLKASYRICLLNPALWTNYPRKLQDSFKRDRFRKVDSPPYNGISDWKATLTVKRPGTYQYYLRVGVSDEERMCEMGYFVVTSDIYLNGKILPIRSICTLTVLTRCLGTIDKWDAHFRKAAQLGYNAIHFTPFNKLGQSGSAYCIREQLEFSDSIFPPPVPSASNKAIIVTKAIDKLVKTHNIFPIIDVVWNHTSGDSQWLREHPDACYNTENSPYFKPALELDRAICALSADIGNGHYSDRGLVSIENEGDLDLVMYILEFEVIPSLHLYEYYVVNVNTAINEFRKALADSDTQIQPSSLYHSEEEEVLKREALYRLPGGDRWSLKVDIPWAIKLFGPYRSRFFDKSKLQQRVSDYQAVLNRLNLPIYEKLNKNIKSAITNIRNRIYYERLDRNGPLKTELSAAVPLTDPYFSEIKCSDSKTIWAANNGWMWNGDSTRNFAALPGVAYLRRDLIIWGDLVKLRYGLKPADSPWLWKHMEAYTRMNAQNFMGFRLDNCHGTPIHVAVHLLDVARSVRPDIFVTAELFTGSEEVDQLFASKLGISALIRESMQASTSQELGRITHRYGGEYVGRLRRSYSPGFYSLNPSPKIPSIRNIRPILPTTFFYDCTHDNETPHTKRTAQDALSNAALVWMTRGLVGTTAGYDYLVAKNPPVTESRLYPTYPDDVWEGMMLARKILNDLHQHLEFEKYKEIHIHQTGELIVVQRHDPSTHQGVYCIVHCAFSDCNNTCASPEIHGEISEYIMCGRLSFRPRDQLIRNKRKKDILLSQSSIVDSQFDNSEFAPLFHDSQLVDITTQDDKYLSDTSEESNVDDLDEEFDQDVPKEVTMSDQIILGEKGFLMLYEPQEFKYIFTVKQCEGETSYPTSRICWKEFPPGSVLILKTKLTANIEESIALLKTLDSPEVTRRLIHAFESVDALDACYALYYCDAEEMAYTNGTRGVYNVPRYGDLIYAGFQGFVDMLDKIRQNNDLGHPFCDNLRAGDWAIDYILCRLNAGPSSLRKVAEWVQYYLTPIKDFPCFLKPKYFDVVVMKVYLALKYHVLHINNNFCNDQCRQFIFENTDAMVEQLVLCGVQMVSNLPNSSIISPSIIGSDNFQLSMAAGFPHFAQGFMRCWGRDTFISLRGLLLLTGRFDDAWRILVGFAANLRHGLIPNLVDSSNNPRYNSRDSTWWFMEALQHFCLMAPDGHKCLHRNEVPQLYPNDDVVVTHGNNSIQYVTMASVIQSIMERHARGIHFRERNAGRQLDSLMQDIGFNIDISLDLETGFILGGNEFNCGTWMDKMGSSTYAHNFGIPATPRDGAAIEIVALVKSAVRWLSVISGSVSYDQLKNKNQAHRSADLNEIVNQDLCDSQIHPNLNNPNQDSNPVQSPQYPVNEINIHTAVNTNQLRHNTIQKTRSEEDFFTTNLPCADLNGHPIEEDKVLTASELLPPLFEKKMSNSSYSLYLFSNKPKPVTMVVNQIFKEQLKNAHNTFPWKGVTFERDGITYTLTYEDWSNRIQENFERCFFIPADVEQDSKYDVKPNYVNRRGIYKDSYMSSHKWTDYQLRPNICIAMVIAPELFELDHALKTLINVQKYLLGPMGMKTLDPGDRQYHPNYDNKNYSENYFTSTGFNYHLGPEWVWLFGYFLRARMQFRDKDSVPLINQIQRLLEPHRETLNDSPWHGLPELTNLDGSTCWGSCFNQSWSAGCILEAMFDMQLYDTT